MTAADVDAVVAGLTEPQRKGLVALTGDFQTGRSLRSVTLTARRTLCRMKLAEAEDAQRAVWNYRLTPLGLLVRARIVGEG